MRSYKPTVFPEKHFCDREDCIYKSLCPLFWLNMEKQRDKKRNDDIVRFIYKELLFFIFYAVPESLSNASRVL